MCILIGYVNNGTVYFATDTRVVDDNRIRNEICECNYKVRKLSNGIIYGVSGDKMNKQLFKMNEDIFTLDKNGKLSVKHIAREIIPKIFDLCKKNQLLALDEDNIPRINFEILLGYNGDLFGICENINVCKYKGFQIIGEMSNYAFGKIMNIDKTKDIEKQMVEALKICASFSTYVGGPYLTINSTEKEYKIWEG